MLSILVLILQERLADQTVGCLWLDMAPNAGLLLPAAYFILQYCYLYLCLNTSSQPGMTALPPRSAIGWQGGWASRADTSHSHCVSHNILAVARLMSPKNCFHEPGQRYYFSSQAPTSWKTLHVQEVVKLKPPELWNKATQERETAPTANSSCWAFKAKATFF